MGAYEITWICNPERAEAARPDPPPEWNMQFLCPGDALAHLAGAKADAIVLECPLPGWQPAELLEEIQRSVSGTPVLIHDAGATPVTAVQLARLGARQFLTPGQNPFAAIEVIVEEQRRGEIARLAGSVEDSPWERFLVGRSHEMRQISHIIRLVGARRASVLITGETGTGKELAARALHMAGNRAGRPFVAVNCSALPETLLESELFGHVRGAFTGAWQSRTGRFEEADGGTIFLDEIGELPMELQSKLLRVLQEREVQRLGSSEVRKLDIRVIAATNCDLLDRIERNEFREDLYYRLNVVPLKMPPLRERPGDVPLLARHFVDKVCRAEGLPPKRLTPEAEDRLCTYAWPGNVRQLENSIETAVALSGNRPLLIPADFPAQAASRPRAFATVPAISLPDGGLDYESTLAGIEKSIIEQALLRTGGNKKAAADMLRLKRTTLSAKVRSLAFG
jgi:DNA-binding NtrC family response regulator